MTNRKKMALAGLLVLVMVGSAVMGTLAYLTDTSSLENAFLVGVFTPPKDPKPDPIDPPKPDPDSPNPPTPSEDQKGKPTGFIYEPYWNANGADGYNGDDHRLLNGEITVKDPYIGIGAKSEEGYVLAYIENPMGDNVYFTPCKGWLPVDGQATEVTITDSNGKPTGAPADSKFYSSGLFKWVGVDGSDNTVTTANTLGKLTPVAPNPDGATDADKKGKDAWTAHPVFTYVYTDKTDGVETIKGFNDEAKQKMTVHAFIHQTNGVNSEGTEAAADYSTVITAATAWADGIKNPTPAPPGFTPRSVHSRIERRPERYAKAHRSPVCPAGGAGGPRCLSGLLLYPGSKDHPQRHHLRLPENGAPPAGRGGRRAPLKGRRRRPAHRQRGGNPCPAKHFCEKHLRSAHVPPPQAVRHRPGRGGEHLFPQQHPGQVYRPLGLGVPKQGRRMVLL